MTSSACTESTKIFILIYYASGNPITNPFWNPACPRDDTSYNCGRARTTYIASENWYDVSCDTAYSTVCQKPFE